ncbi:MAG TPA: hypothetical protein VIN77_00320, partial [Aurantimonas sp.]
DHDGKGCHDLFRDIQVCEAHFSVTFVHVGTWLDTQVRRRNRAPAPMPVHSTESLCRGRGSHCRGISADDVPCRHPRTIGKNAYEFVLANDWSRVPDENSAQKQTPAKLDANLTCKKDGHSTAAIVMFRRLQSP